jgi:hypothetical protein
MTSAKSGPLLVATPLRSTLRHWYRPVSSSSSSVTTRVIALRPWMHLRSGDSGGSLWVPGATCDSGESHRPRRGQCCRFRRLHKGKGLRPLRKHRTRESMMSGQSEQSPDKSPAPDARPSARRSSERCSAAGALAGMGDPHGKPAPADSTPYENRSRQSLLDPSGHNSCYEGPWSYPPWLTALSRWLLLARSIGRMGPGGPKGGCSRAPR